MAINNPYVPGDPYSYDLKWQVDHIKYLQSRVDDLDTSVQAATDQADRAENEADRATDRANDSDTFALKSEGFAVGEQNGTPVASDSPYYENNAKYYCDEAADSAQNAADSEQSAADYAAHIADPVSGLVTTWLAAHITQPTTPAIDDTLSVGGAAADAQAAGYAVNVAAQYARENALSLFRFNLLNYDSELNVAANFVSSTDGYLYPSANYDTSYYIPVKPSTTYYVAGYYQNSNYLNAYSVAEYDAEHLFITGYSAPAVSFTTSATTKFVRMSWRNSVSRTNVGISEIPLPQGQWTRSTALRFKPNTGGVPQARNRYDRMVTDNPGGTADIRMTSFLYVPRLGEIISAKLTDITNFVSFEVGRRSTSTKYNRVVVTPTHITGYNYDGSVVLNVDHDLTITNELNIRIVQNQILGASIELRSNGDIKTFNCQYNLRYLTFPYIENAGSTLGSMEISATNTQFNKSIWMFGDSYFGYSNHWFYYFTQTPGYIKNVFANSYPGADSAVNRTCLEALLNQLIPNTVIWCPGMNDGTDTGGVPNAAWLAEVQKLINYSNAYGFDVILATIPTVPSINNEEKNAWVRSSGYQYIDFAKAVGAQADGTWYAGMLSGDNVHPTLAGALALYSEAITDAPQLCIED